MRRAITSILDTFRWERNQRNPHYQAWHHRPAGDIPLAPTSHELPHLNLLTDPIGQWSNALQDFHDWQLQSGFDLLKAGVEPQTASDLQNVMAAQSHHGMAMGSALPTSPFLPPVMHEPRHIEPWNNPLSTVPGAPHPLIPGG